MSWDSNPFRKGSERAREAGRKGGSRTPGHKRKAPYTGTVLQAMAKVPDMQGDSWSAWRALLKATFGLPASPEERLVYERHTARKLWPEHQVSECWTIAGRRGGKSRIAALLALYLGIRFDASKLAQGELGLVPVVARNKDQAAIVLGYFKALCQLPAFRPYVSRVLKTSIELASGITVQIQAASFRTLRGFTVVGAVLDEVGFWSLEGDSLNPDQEICNAIRPGMSTVPDALLFGISSPYARKGELWQISEQFFGRDDRFVLVWNADSRSMNDTVPEHVIQRAYERDPLAAAAEFGVDGRVEFRSDIEAFLEPAAIQAVTVRDRLELPPSDSIEYKAFCDPAGGSGKDSFTIAIGHAVKENGNTRAVLDAVRERKPRFSPDDAIREFAELLATYGVTSVTGDRYGGEFPRELFRQHGIQYEPSTRSKSDLYKEMIAPVNAGRLELLDLPVLRAQLLALERKTARGGRDSIDHPSGGRDDIANSVAGVLVNVLPQPRKPGIPLQWR